MYWCTVETTLYFAFQGLLGWIYRKEADENCANANLDILSYCGSNYSN